MTEPVSEQDHHFYFRLSARLRTFEAALYKFAHYITLHYIIIQQISFQAENVQQMRFNCRSVKTSLERPKMSREYHHRR